MISTTEVLTLRRAAQLAGLRPVDVEVGPDCAPDLVGAVCFAGMRVRPRSEPGAAVLALPNRRIGRYEVVCPARFEAAA